MPASLPDVSTNPVLCAYVTSAVAWQGRTSWPYTRPSMVMVPSVGLIHRSGVSCGIPGAGYARPHQLVVESTWLRPCSPSIVRKKLRDESLSTDLVTGVPSGA